MTTQILIVDSAGMPREWTDYKTGACYYARNKVIYGIGPTLKTFIGGKDCNGEISRIDVASILGVTGPLFGTEFYEKVSKWTERDILYGRDRLICAYCGIKLVYHKATIDHITPKSQGGQNIWMNTVTSCGGCNRKKRDRTPEEAEMPLLYLPYVPSKFEKILLKGRNVIADQMDWLMQKMPKGSRTWLDYKKSSS